MVRPQSAQLVRHASGPSYTTSTMTDGPLADAAPAGTAYLCDCNCPGDSNKFFIFNFKLSQPESVPFSMSQCLVEWDWIPCIWNLGTPCFMNSYMKKSYAFIVYMNSYDLNSYMWIYLHMNSYNHYMNSYLRWLYDSCTYEFICEMNTSNLNYESNLSLWI